MRVEIGSVEAVFRYPVKSMRGELLRTATMGWHGIEGDRRFALRRVGHQGGMPWLTAGKLPELVLFAPTRQNGGNDESPTHVLTPDGRAMPLFGGELAKEIGDRHGTPVKMMQLNHGVFDEASISVITTATVSEVCRLAGRTDDVRRFRPNILVRSDRQVAFGEDEWLGSVLTFGNGDGAPAVVVTMPDIRCVMINIDPDTAARVPEMMKAVVRANDNKAGVYGAVTRAGLLAPGQSVFLLK